MNAPLWMDRKEAEYVEAVWHEALQVPPPPVVTPVEECEVCGRTGVAARACRFEVACSCWRGVPCKGTGRKSRKGGAS